MILIFSKRGFTDACMILIFDKSISVVVFLSNLLI